MWGHGGRYQDWSDFLEQWSAGTRLDPAVLPHLREEDFTGDSWQRLTNRLTEALSRRLTRWAQALGHAIGEARDEFSVGRALAQARAGLHPIRALSGHPGLPPELRGQLTEMVERQVRSAERSLERQVDNLRRGGASRQSVEARLRTIRDNALSAAPPPAAQLAPGTGWYADPGAPRRRRVVITDRPDRPEE